MRISKLNENKMYKRVKKIINSNILVSVIGNIIIWLLALIPTYLYFVFRILLEPVGFWQEISLFAICFFILGGPQILFIIVAVLITINSILGDL